MLNFGELNVVVSIIFKILRECNWTNESQILDIRENKRFTAFCTEKGVTLGVFDGATTDYRKKII